MAPKLQPIPGVAWLVWIGCILFVAGFVLALLPESGNVSNSSTTNQGSSRNVRQNSPNSSGGLTTPTVALYERAKNEIPGLLSAVYKALNQGNPQSVNQTLSRNILQDSRALDLICRPFAYRAHYVEEVIERPNQIFLAKVHVLFQPVEEHAQLLEFRLWENRFYLANASELSSEWLKPQLSASKDVARKFLYALLAGRGDVASTLVVSSFSVNDFLNDSWRRFFTKIKSFEISSADLVSHYGLKVKVQFTSTNYTALTYYTWDVYVEPNNGENKIVRWHCAPLMGQAVGEEAPDLEQRTLKRFGLPGSSSERSQDPRYPRNSRIP